ncbi:Rieske 2Fe-2S domain-containing protein [Desulfobacterales bacterium HSG2]|nr:Rieske 2Fe-2S domain-containing protein [Desulfobacterales bacterium HSG2]
MIWKYICGSASSPLSVSFSERPRDGQVIFNSGVYLIGVKSGLLALSARCPHLGCQLAYNAADRRFQCPCHGSQFSLKGHRLKGPAKKEMTVLELRQDHECEGYKVIF